MKSYHTANSNEGLRLPHSGLVIGRLADALRLKAALREDWSGASYKTVQRYFRGERVEPATVDGILDALVTTLVPASLEVRFGDEPGGTSLHALVQQGLRYYARVWDAFAAEVNAHGYPVYEPRDLPVPVLRLVVLDVGIRWGAWACLQALDGRVSTLESGWLSEAALGNLIDRLRSGKELTVSAIAERLDVSEQAIEAWRSGHSLPTSNHIETLAACLADGPEERHAIEYLVRLVVGLMAIHRDLVALCGQRRIQDMLDAMSLTARHVRDWLFQAPGAYQPAPTLDHLRAELWEVVLHGARCPPGAMAAEQLARVSAFNQEVAADFLALPGDWVRRASYWMAHLGMAPKRLEFARTYFAERGCIPAERIEFVCDAAEGMLIKMANFDWHPGPDGKWLLVQPPPEGKAANRLLQAERAASVEDYETAVEHLRHAVKHQPLDAGAHFKLGAFLGIMAFQGQQPQRFEEALLECRLAVEIDPEFGNARNEIGIILSNARRHEEAEQAFAQAEPYYGNNAHHWFARANNYLALGRYEDARTSFEKAIECSKDGNHVKAMRRLAATLMALGKEHEARRLGKKVEHLTGVDPTSEWERVLSVWE